MYVKFKKNVAQGVYYTHAGLGQVAYARKEVVIAAGHRSSLLLENSGVGNKVGWWGWGDGRDRWFLWGCVGVMWFEWIGWCIGSGGRWIGWVVRMSDGHCPLSSLSYSHSPTAVPPLAAHAHQMIIEPILSRVGFPLVADVPGVGEHLGNDGAVTMTFNRPPTAAIDANKDNLYAGGAFTPYPNAAANRDDPFQVG